MYLGHRNKGSNAWNLQRSIRPLVLLLFLLLFQPAFAEEKTVEEDSWLYAHIIQPVLNAAVYPLSAPVQYALNNGVVEKSVELMSFGEDKKIFVYPTMNLKPGTQTQLGMTYRHRSILFNRDYLVLQGSYYANGDLYLSDRYTKQEPFGLPLFVGFRYKLYWDSDANFIIPGTKEAFIQPD